MHFQAEIFIKNEKRLGQIYGCSNAEASTSQCLAECRILSRSYNVLATLNYKVLERRQKGDKLTHEPQED